MRKPIPFGKYVLVERVAIGGMAEVFLAKSFGVDGFERALAIKRILPSMVEDQEFIAMFRDEARIAAVLHHANIAQVYEFEKFGENYSMAMEYVSGRDLRGVFQRYRAEKRGLPVPQAAYILSKVCEGLDYAHRKKDQKGNELHIIHRDISPQNVLLSFDGEVKLIDFGIAKAANRLMKTQAGVLKGKFGYMSPEQVDSSPIDHRSDVFAVGIVLWEILTGQKLFAGDTDMSTLERVRHSVIVPPTRVNPDVPRDLEAVVMKALAREPDHRYAWASDMQEDLARNLVLPDGTVFGAKHLSAWLRETFAEEYQREQERLARHAHVGPPSAEAEEEEEDDEPRVARLDDTKVFLEPADDQEITQRLKQHEIEAAQRDEDSTAVRSPPWKRAGARDEERTMASHKMQPLEETLADEDRTAMSRRAAPAAEAPADDALDPDTTRASRPEKAYEATVAAPPPARQYEATVASPPPVAAEDPDVTRASRSGAPAAAAIESTTRSPVPIKEYEATSVAPPAAPPAPVQADAGLMAAALGGVEGIAADEVTNTFSRRRKVVPWLGTAAIVGAALVAGLAAYLLIGRQSGPPATLIVIGRPADRVEILVDGERVTGSPYIGQDLAAGPHQIEIRAPGHATYAEEVVLQAGKALQIEKDLVPTGGP